MTKKVAIFSGSFNPIHIGHLALANYICEAQLVDELWFMVTPQNPLKENKELIDETHRLNMVKKAIDGYEKFKACDLEFSLPRPSYTVNTLQALKNKYQDINFSLLIGADNWANFNQWKNGNDILKHFSLLVYPRMGFDIEVTKLPPNVEQVDSPILEISATEIRDKIAEGKDYRYFLHHKVFDYISEHKLYNVLT